jgi:hypothetical protein
MNYEGHTNIKCRTPKRTKRYRHMKFNRIVKGKPKVQYRLVATENGNIIERVQ